MKDLKIRLSTECCNSAMKACGESLHWQSSLELFGSMSWSALQRSVISLNSVIDSGARGSEWQSVLGHHLQDTAPDAITFSSSTSSLANCKLWMGALQLLSQMTCMALRPHDAMYNSLLGSLENSGHWVLATNLLEEMIGRRLLETWKKVSHPLKVFNNN